MGPESLRDFLIEFVNHGIVPMVVKEVSDSGDSIDLEELDAAQLQVQKEVIRFFEGLDTAEELDAHLVNLPTWNYLKLSLRQHILFARLKSERDSVPQVVEMSSDSKTPADQDPKRVLERLARHFGLTMEDQRRILDMLGE